MKLELTDAALADIQSIRCYTLEQWGERQEELYLQALWEKLELISKYPQQYRSRNDLFPGCQLATEGKHVILFHIQDNILQIARVLHHAMDYPRHL